MVAKNEREKKESNENVMNCLKLVSTLGMRILWTKKQLRWAKVTIDKHCNSEFLGTSQTQSRLFLMWKKSLHYVTDNDNSKELNYQVKRFLIGNGHCLLKSSYLRDWTVNFLGKIILYYFRWKSKTYLILCCCRRHILNHVGYLQNGRLKIYRKFG